MSETDPEIAALITLIKTLEPLKDEQRLRVLGFVFQRLNIRMSGAGNSEREERTGGDLATILGTTLDEKQLQSNKAKNVSDIRSLKEQKKPRTANEMAALVAFYLEHIATGDERRDFITPDDVKKYFNQAGFPLPTGPQF